MEPRSSLFPERFDFPLSRKEIFFLGVLAALALSIYVATSLQTLGPGFPLDDAWIHQTYARNLAQRHEWAFIPGQPSAGATSPLWVVLLAFGYWLGTNPFIETFFLGWLLLWALGVIGALTFARLASGHEKIAVWIGALLIFEWHLVWASASGMETALFTVISMICLLFVMHAAPDQSTFFWLAGGAVVGWSGLTRPEGLSLLAPLLIAIFLTRPGKPKLKAIFALLLGFALFFIPYLLFNYALSGFPWPTTFYAKQAEYAALLTQPLWLRLGREFFQPLIGPGLLLWPGFFIFLRKAMKERNWQQLLPIAWAFGLLTLFALRLPVVYQHGRYAIPAMPILFVFSAAGISGWIETKPKNNWRRRLSIAWLQALALLLLLMYLLGAQAYARDVAFIQSEMVTAANWVKGNTPEHALIAAHDIGALGYFAQRPLLDLAGLVSPQVIPFIRDEGRLRIYLNQEGADFLVTFPGWYPHLVVQAELVYRTGGQIGPSLGGENLAVYRWRPIH